MTTFYDDHLTMVDGKPRTTKDGYLVANVRVARTGIQIYGGHQVDPDGSLGLRDRAEVKVYRPPEEVFHQDSLNSYAHRPVTNDHPMELVTADNWKSLAVGQTGGEVVRDGDWVVVPMVLMDSGMIQAVKAGKQELSMGYQCLIDPTPGVTADGQEYDVIQRNQRMNHLAVVDAARAGPEARIVDKQGDMPPVNQEDAMSMKTVVLGDQAVNVAAEDESKFVAYKADVAKQLTDASNTISRLEAERDNWKSKAEDAEKRVPNASAMDAAVAARADLISKAKAIAPAVKFDGLSEADIRKAVVVAKFGDAMSTKEPLYIDSRFDMLVEDLGSTQQISSAIENAPSIANDAAAYDAALAREKSNFNKRFNQ